ncbi:hypothetical protein [uncultured Algibacter sp.]|uniref:hypothetical protein n=1 Tax=uncultured Algibacter sp. TaxID=298659 RepID=UPI00260D6895|nr:hypothetical protein [uncultured Algibacter sp.]
MKNKLIIRLNIFIILCSLSLKVNAQKKTLKKDFEINVIKPSDKPNFENEHIHVLELKNNSKLKSEYKVSLIDDNCSKGKNKAESNINSQISFENSNKASIDNIVSLEPNESIKMNLKIQKKNNAKLDSWNCSIISVIKLSNLKSKNTKSNISKSVTIKTFIPNPIHKGH